MTLRSISTTLLVASALLLTTFRADAATRWTLRDDGAIEWRVASDANLPHDDRIEASGEQLSTVLRYDVDAQGAFHINRSVVWPMLRTIPNNTHASLTLRFDFDPIPTVELDGRKLSGEKTQTIALDGVLTVLGRFDRDGKPALQVERKFFPSTTKPFLCERFAFRNLSDADVKLVVPEYRRELKTDADKGFYGAYSIVEKSAGALDLALAPGATAQYDLSIQGFAVDKGESELEPDFDAEENARRAFVQEMWSNLVLETPEPILDRAFAFAKIRASESIYRTKGGLMHGPGGESYYAALWANDQAEYVNPFFPFLGYKTGVESAFNSFMHFARFMNDDYKPIPSSIIAEGIDIWNGAGDRGDAAMIAHGASRYALERADVEEAKRLWPLVEWCLEYSRRKINGAGVVASDCDELERRFPAGDANLCTSTLYYDALISAVALGGELGVDASQLARYEQESEELRANIERHFGANVGGFETYRYFAGCEKLRSWICMPLVVGIDDRAEGTIAALFSDKLWTPDGLRTEEGSKTFWDRSTLYALRGVFAAGATEQALDHLRRYSQARLLGEHVPYPIEAWPEGSQRHLSAESGLYCRVYVEGLFGVRPTGFDSFETTPRLPKAWNSAALRRVRAFGRTFDLVVSRGDDETLDVEISVLGGASVKRRIADGATLDVVLPQPTSDR